MRYYFRKAAQETPPRDSRRHRCTDRSEQPVRAVYTRMGTPAKWTKVGRVCLRCQTFWPEQLTLLELLK